MPKFKFRLEAALSLAERALEEKQRCLALELEKFNRLQARCREQEKSWQIALKGQKEAGRHSPHDLGQWQSFAQKQFEVLRLLERETAQQGQVVLEKRQALMIVHQETEKLKKIKGKQKAKFILAEQRKEQGILDEAGQIIFRRNHRTRGIF